MRETSEFILHTDAADRRNTVNVITRNIIYPELTKLVKNYV